MAPDQLDRRALGDGRAGRSTLFARGDQIEGGAVGLDPAGSIAAAVLTRICGESNECLEFNSVSVMYLSAKPKNHI